VQKHEKAKLAARAKGLAASEQSSRLAIRQGQGSQARQAGRQNPADPIQAKTD